MLKDEIWENLYNKQITAEYLQIKADEADQDRKTYMWNILEHMPYYETKVIETDEYIVVFDKGEVTVYDHEEFDKTNYFYQEQLKKGIL